MIKIDMLKNHPQAIPALARIWHEGLGKIWMPEIGLEEIESLYHEELKLGMPITYIALSGETPIGSCTFQIEDDFRQDLGPWIADLVVHPNYQKQGIGQMLLDVAVEKAKDLNFKKLYLFAFDPQVPAYYQRLSWEIIGVDEFKSHSVIVMEMSIS